MTTPDRLPRVQDMEQVRRAARRTPAALAGLVLAVGLAGCGATADPESGTVPSAAPSASGSASGGASGGATTQAETPRASPPRTASPTPDEPREEQSGPATRRGVDVSHHQGPVDWRRVRADGIGFAYLKATEGSTFVDPRFAEHARRARRAGLHVGGYHYFTLCSPGAPQGEHFVEVLDPVLGSGPAGTMPPAVDLELAGNCPEPPARAALLAEIRAFVDVVERGTRQRVVVYAYPDFEARFGIAAALDRRLWVRRIGSRPPQGSWWLWQRDDRARVDGIDGPVDLNLLSR